MTLWFAPELMLIGLSCFSGLSAHQTGKHVRKNLPRWLVNKGPFILMPIHSFIQIPFS